MLEVLHRIQPAQLLILIILLIVVGGLALGFWLFKK